MEITTPDQVIRELNRLQTESAKGIEALYAAEKNLVELDIKHDNAYSKALLKHEGSIALREALARLDSESERFQRDLARVEVNRIKLKLKQISEASVAASVIGRQVELTWRHA
jgi:hypothetical protein